MRTAKLIVILLLASLFVVSAFGQATTAGTLRGTTSDPSKAFVVGAQITVTDAATGRTYTAQSNSSGEFVVGNLPPGTYTMTATKQGYKKAVYKDVKIEVS